jgi:hypothetical protein
MRELGVILISDDDCGGAGHVRWVGSGDADMGLDRLHNLVHRNCLPRTHSAWQRRQLDLQNQIYFFGAQLAPSGWPILLVVSGRFAGVEERDKAVM